MLPVTQYLTNEVGGSMCQTQAADSFCGLCQEAALPDTGCIGFRELCYEAAGSESGAKTVLIWTHLGTHVTRQSHNYQHASPEGYKNVQKPCGLPPWLNAKASTARIEKLHHVANRAYGKNLEEYDGQAMALWCSELSRCNTTRA